MYDYAITVTVVHDGDTVHADIDMGFHCTYRTKLRLAGINCPELVTDAGKAARDYTANWVAVAKANGAPLTAHVVGPDKYGDRWDAVITRDSDPTSLNDALVADGHAVVMR